jgi:CRISPR-associated protein Csb2
MPAVPISFVPHNYDRNQLDAKDRAQVLPWGLSQGKISRHFPTVSPERDLVHFIWPSVAPGAVRQAFGTLVEHIEYLGTSSSKVRVAVCDSAPEPEFQPCSEEEPGGDFVLAIPYRGRLAALERAYQGNRQATSGRPVYYKRVALAPPAAAQSAFEDLFVLRTTGRSVLPARHTTTYTGVSGRRC